LIAKQTSLLSMGQFCSSDAVHSEHFWSSINISNIWLRHLVPTMHPNSWSNYFQYIYADVCFFFVPCQVQQ
jgi:hypothetical protein